jgi:hypothetical protein
LALYSFLMQSVFGLTVVLLFTVVSLSQQSPYAGQQFSEIKALYADEIQGYLSGSGMGFAEAAELNHYPGPKHVLELRLAPASGLWHAARDTPAEVASSSHGGAG